MLPCPALRRSAPSGVSCIIPPSESTGEVAFFFSAVTVPMQPYHVDRMITTVILTRLIIIYTPLVEVVNQ